MTEDELKAWRKKIDHLDKEILSRLAERAQISRDVMAWKKEHGIPLLDQVREGEIFNELMSQAENLKVDPELVRDLYERILKYSKEL